MMSVKFFGQFLLERGKIIREELLDALKFQKEVNVKLGTIALDAGYLSAAQVEEIQERQQQGDQLFGEVAVKLKYLAQDQVDELLLIQKNERISLGESLLQKRYLSMSDLERELAEYKKAQEGVTEKALAAVKESKDSIIPANFLDLTIKLFRRLVDIEVQVIESHNDADRIAPHLWNIYQCFDGDTKGLYVMSVPEPIFLQVASHVAQEKIWEVDNFAKDAAQEFVNVVVGNSIAKLSQEGMKFSLEPPKIFTSLGRIEISPESTETVVVKLGSNELQDPEHSVQIAILYSPLKK